MSQEEIYKLHKLSKLSKKFPNGVTIKEYYEDGAIRLSTSQDINIGPIIPGSDDLYKALLELVNKSKSRKASNGFEHDSLYKKLLPIFKYDTKVTNDFINEVIGKRNHDVTEVVRRYRNRKKLDEELCHKNMWRIFVSEGMYNHTDRNWNERIE